MTRIAFIGLGAMGARMARRLVDAGHELIVYNRTVARAEPLTRLAATLASSPRAAAAQAELVLTMVTDDAAAQQIWLDSSTGIVAGLQPQAIAIECSTVTPSWIRTLRTALNTVELLDAPVAGSRPQAESGQLIFLVGGDRATFDKARPVLDGMAGAIHHVGPSGSGAWLKLAVNSLFAVQVAATSELMGLMRKANIQPDTTASILGQMPITSPAIKGVIGLIANEEHRPLFPIDLVEKDLRYAVSAGQVVGQSLPTTDAVHALFRRAQKAGYGQDNISGLVQLFMQAG